jgi:hypothetical protein
MSKKHKAAQGSAAPENTVVFARMSVMQKLAHIGKACVFFLTLGFAFPNIFSD